MNALAFAVLLSSLSLIHALPSQQTNYGSLTSIRTRQDAPTLKATDAFDHSWIENIASIGDSYGAGLGSGHSISATKGLVLNTDCYQYSYGYPNLINNDGFLGGNSNRVLEFLACSNDKTKDLGKQIDKMSISDVVTISIGGNDLGFVTIINHCIFQWGKFFWQTWDCQGKLNEARDEANGDAFNQRLRDVVKSVEGKLRDKNSRIYWTGYDRFWNADTPECDKITWSFFGNYLFREFLTRDRRKQMNDITDLLNQKIKDACGTSDRCVFVEANDQVDEIQGHFCEPGVDEYYGWPGGGRAANREESAFYEWGTTKDADEDDEKEIDQPQKRQVPAIKADNSTLQGEIAALIQLGLSNGEIDPEVAKYALPGFTTNTLPIPDYFAKTFHRTKYGNGLMAVKVVKAMDVEQGKMLGQPSDPVQAPICRPLQAAAQTSTPTPTPTPTQCQGNQVQGDCVQGSLPSTGPNGGPQPPVCNKIGTENVVRISDAKTKDAVSQYCQNLIDGKVVLDAKNTSPKPGTVPDAAEGGGQLALSILFDVDVCDKDTKPEDQKVDFGAMKLEDCFMNLYTNLAMTCAQDSTWTDYNKDFSLEGGIYGYKCALWSMSGNKV